MARLKNEGNGDCMVVATRNALNSNLLFCYAKVMGQKKLKGIRFMHAWNEIDNFVIDMSNGNCIIMFKEEYYKLAKIKDSEVKRMSISELREAVSKSKYYGEWVDGF